MLFADLLQRANDLLEPPPRRIGWLSGRELRLKRPRWARSDRRFDGIFRDQDLLLEHGHAVWAKLVQANALLFVPGPDDCPAAVIYSADPRAGSAPLAILEPAARGLFALKGQRVSDPSLQVFADKLADEYVLDLKLPVPETLAGPVPCIYTCILVQRSHLPEGRLMNGLLPLLVAPQRTDATMILPLRFWPEELVSYWMGEETG